jgi:hypothetical protein
MVKLQKAGGFLALGSQKKKIEAARDDILVHLADGKPIDELPAAAHRLLDPAAVRAIRIVQPALPDELVFAGVPVFGAGRIAALLPKSASDAEAQYVSFALSEFREFSRLLSEVFGIEGLGAANDVPASDALVAVKCQVSNQQLTVLENSEMYQADPAYKLKLVAHRCGSCGFVIGEEARKKEKLGGAKGAGIAKAKCPQCKSPLGAHPLYAIESGPPAAPAPADAPPESAGAESAGESIQV